MRKYRARQRSDPIRYQQYLERERMRNYKRKYEKRIKAAQDEALAAGIPYIVLETPPRRGRKPKFPNDNVSLVLPAKYEDDIEDESNSFDSHDMPMIPVKVELQESDEIYQEQKPSISVVNINKLMNYPRMALQTLMPQEVSDRERVSNFIKLEHDYVKQGTDQMVKMEMDYLDSESRNGLDKVENKSHKRELLKLQEQCRSFVLNKVLSEGSRKPKRKRRLNRIRREMSTDFVPDHYVEHEDLDDLFKELAEVANKEPPKKKHLTISPRKSHSPRKRSLNKQSPHKKSLLKLSPLKQIPSEDYGRFSLTVAMPVQPIVTPKFKTDNLKNLFDFNNIEESDGPKISSISNDDMHSIKKTVCNQSEIYNYCDEDSIEIKQEPINSDDDLF